MKSRMCYLAVPIDFWMPMANSKPSLGELAAERLAACGFVVYSPATALITPGKGVERDSRLAQVNRRALELSDCLLALVPQGTVTYGVPMELEAARQRGLPTAVVVDSGSALSWSLAEFKQFLDWGHAVEWLDRAVVAGGSTTTLLKVEAIQGFKWEQVAPRRGYDDDAGFDLMVAASAKIEPGQFVDVQAGVKVELPVGTWAMITGRSSTLRKRGLLVNTAVIDSGYRGPLFAGVWNLTDSPVIVNEGERIAQLIPMPNLAESMGVVRVDKLGEGTRGEKGFGSSGV